MVRNCQTLFFSHRYMYFTTVQDRSAKIEGASLDGTEREIPVYNRFDPPCGTGFGQQAGQTVLGGRRPETDWEQRPVW